MHVGFVGFGKMGSRMVTKLLHGGYMVHVWNRSRETVEEFKSQSIRQAQDKNAKGKIEIQNLNVEKTIQELVNGLQKPRVTWMMLPAGEATQAIFDELLPLLEKDDILIDGGNAYYKDTQKRFEQCEKKGIRFLGIGVSGGIHAAKNGFPLMVGGDRSAYELVSPVLDSLAKPNGGHYYFGLGGVGHFIKMVHNAIEYSYMQGIGEGFGILEKSPYDLDLKEVAKLYTKNTLISGFMMDRTVEVLEQDPRLEQLDGVIGKASGETIWAIEEAKKLAVPIENIEQAFEFRNRSETDLAVQKSFAARMVSSLRRAFGGHSVKKKA